MRILVWHGWLLEGSGSNVYTARVVEAWRARGHDVLLLCQESRPDRYPFLDAAGTVDGPIAPRDLGAEPAAGRAVLLRPYIGELLPVFVYDEYEGFRVRRFVDLSREELDGYLDANVRALRAAAARHGSELVVAGHAIPGPVVARRAVEGIPMVAKVHGSDIEYAMREDPRYVELAREGLEGAAAVAGASRDVLDRLIALVPSVAGRVRVVAPGVDVKAFRPRPRREALLRAAALVEDEPARRQGRPDDVRDRVAEALRARDGEALDRLAGTYEQDAPDPAAPERLRALAGHRGPLVGYLGKLIPQKGVDLLLGALAGLGPETRALLVGFGRFREWLEALVLALDAGDAEAARFLRGSSPMTVDLSDEDVASAAGLANRVAFTGRLDHRYAAPAVAGLDVLVVPSVLEEAFGMVALEGAAAGALPLVARHSGLAEVAHDLEAEIGLPGLLSFEPGPGATGNLTRAIRRLLAIPAPERRALGHGLSDQVSARRSWTQTADRLLEAAIG